MLVIYYDTFGVEDGAKHLGRFLSARSRPNFQLLPNFHHLLPPGQFVAVAFRGQRGIGQIRVLVEGARLADAAQLFHTCLPPTFDLSIGGQSVGEIPHNRG